jgi:hypothetical protein
MPIARQGGLLFDFPSGKSQSARRLSGPPGSAAGSVLSTKYSPSRLGHPGQSHCTNRLRLPQLPTRCGLHDRFQFITSVPRPTLPRTEASPSVVRPFLCATAHAMRASAAANWDDWMSYGTWQAPQRSGCNEPSIGSTGTILRNRSSVHARGRDVARRDGELGIEPDPIMRGAIKAG